MKKSILIFIIVLKNTLLHLNAQVNIDALATANAQYTQYDTVKVGLLVRLAEGYNKSRDAANALLVASQAVELAKKLDDPNGAGQALYQCSMAKYNQGQVSEARPLLEEALTYFKRTGNQRKIVASLYWLSIYSNVLWDFKSSIVTAEQSAKIYGELGEQLWVAHSCQLIATAYRNLGETEKAATLFDQALQTYVRLKDRVSEIQVYNNLGLLYWGQSDYLQALDHFQKALKTNEQVGNISEQINILQNIGGIYLELENFPKGIEYTQLALKEIKKNNIQDPTALLMVYGNLATGYLGNKESDKALEYNLLTLSITEGDPDLEYQRAIVEGNIGSLYQNWRQYGLALDYHQRALAIFQKVESSEDEARTWMNIGEVLYVAPDSALQNRNISVQNRMAMSEENLLKALTIAETNNLPNLVAKASNKLSIFYEKKGDYINAYRLYSQSIAIKDSIAGDEVNKAITRKQIQFEFDKKEAELKFQNQHTADLLEQQRLIAVQQAQQLRIKDQALQISNKEKELQHLAYLKEKAEKQEKEQALSLAESQQQLQAADLATLAKEKLLQAENLAKQNALIGFLLAVLAALALAALAYYWWQRQRQSRKETLIQQQFTRQLLEHTEAERGRIARDLHDGVSHELLMLKRNLEGDHTNANQKIDLILNDIRQISRNLQPVMLENIGLQLSLESLCEQYMEQHQLFIAHDIEYNSSLAPNAELHVFRIVQEALTNTIKYAAAQAANVVVKSQASGFVLIVEDNGKGFDVDATLKSGQSFGLNSILQRGKLLGAQASIQSSTAGTRVEVRMG
jgi:signal transduction histidine kinase